MVNCPNCGHAVPSTQRFCGNCGNDLQASAVSQGIPVSEQQPAPYAYSQPSGYGYEAYPSEAPRSPAPRMILIGGVVVIALCCAFSCGLLLGFELIPDLLGIGGATAPKPTPRPTVTPQSLLPIFHYFFG
ncbi:MAG: zinc ribbon domain-containing protein [Chloroflexi bacterium]|nr:zinc ribbon domain-containing protein [Chloroflexota bacterium]